VARLAADLVRSGIRPRHLPVLKPAADREAEIIEEVVAPLRGQRNPRILADAETTARELVALSLQLHAALVHTALRLRSW